MINLFSKTDDFIKNDSKIHDVIHVINSLRKYDVF